MSGRLGPSGLRARRQRNMTKRNRAGRWRGRGTLVEMQKKELAKRIEDMARRTREQRQAAQAANANDRKDKHYGN